MNDSLENSRPQTDHRLTMADLNQLQPQQHGPEMRAFIRKHGMLFWWIREDAKERLSLNLVTEAVLHYGDTDDIKELFRIAGMEEVAKVFNEQISRKRNPYPKRTAYYFNLYFKRHVPGYIDKKSG
jgi:hypothetical protein